MSDLAKKSCIPCRGGVPALPKDDQLRLVEELKGWQIIDEHHLEKTHTFNSYLDALSFVNQIAEISEAEDHHPEIYFGFKKVRVQIWTHKIDNLTESDFVLAAKFDIV